MSEQKAEKPTRVSVAEMALTVPTLKSASELEALAAELKALVPKAARSDTKAPGTVPRVYIEKGTTKDGVPFRVAVAFVTDKRTIKFHLSIWNADAEEPRFTRPAKHQIIES